MTTPASQRRDPPSSAASPPAGASPHIRWILVSVLAVFTVAGIVRLTPRVQLLFAAASFTQHSGLVTASEVLEHGGRDYTIARVTVRYEVDDRPFTLVTSGTDGRADAAPTPQAFVARHPVGARLPVYVAPGRPHLASLTRRIDLTADLVVLAVLMGLLAIATVWAWRGRRGQKNGVHNAPRAPRV